MNIDAERHTMVVAHARRCPGSLVIQRIKLEGTTVMWLGARCQMCGWFDDWDESREEPVDDEVRDEPEEEFWPPTD